MCVPHLSGQTQFRPDHTHFSSGPHNFYVRTIPNFSSVPQTFLLCSYFAYKLQLLGYIGLEVLKFTTIN